MMETTERLQDVIDLPRAQRLMSKASDQAMRIMSSLDKDIAKARAQSVSYHQDTIKSFEIKKQKFSVQVIGTLKKAWRSFARKLGIISNMNTQDVAEEAQAALVEHLPAFLTEGEFYQEWRSLLDGRERDTHNAAHGQRVKLPDGVFTVGGHKLRHPGDGTQGAPLRETINCRCYLRTIWVKPDGTEEIIEDGELNPSSPTRASRKPGENVNKPRFQKPTRAFTFGVGKGPWRRPVMLGNMQRANVTIGNGGVTIRVGGKPVASAPLTRDTFGNWKLGKVTANPGYDNIGIEDMLRQSVEASNALPR